MYVSTAGVGRRSQKNSGTPSRVQDGCLHTDNISVLALNIRSIITYCSHWHKIVIPKLCCGSCTCTWNDSVFFCCIHCTTRSVMYGYVVELCQPVAGVTSRQHLQSVPQQLQVVPRHQLSSYGRRAFCVAGPSVWNSLPDSLRDPIIGGNSFRQSLKTFMFATYWCIQRIRSFTTMRYIRRPLYLLTYLLTYIESNED